MAVKKCSFKHYYFLNHLFNKKYKINWKNERVCLACHFVEIPTRSSLDAPQLPATPCDHVTRSPLKLPDAFAACRTCRAHAVQNEQLVTVEPALNLTLQAFFCEHERSLV